MKKNFIKYLIKNNLIISNYIKKILYFYIKKNVRTDIYKFITKKQPYFNIGDSVIYNGQLYKVIWIEGIINDMYMYKIKNDFEVRDLISEVLLKKNEL